MNNRIRQCLLAIKKENCDGLLISNPVNITYLTGFRKADGYLLLGADQTLTYFTNFIYADEAKQIKLWEVSSTSGSIFSNLAQKASQLGLQKIGFEAKHLSYLEQQKIAQLLQEKGIITRQTIDLIETLRTIKTADEIKLIKKAISLTLETLDFIKANSYSLTTEKELNACVERLLKLNGDNHLAFPPIIAAGKNSSQPHHIPENTKLADKTFLVDLGARYCGYCADLTRMFSLGKIPPLYRIVYDIVRTAHDRAIKKIKDGVKAKDVDNVARTFITRKGWGKNFGHGTGHGVGLSVHEIPYLNTTTETRLKEGMIITIEPAIYIPGQFGVRLESMVLVKQNKGEILSGRINW